jgi:hypothetical protein
MNAQMKPIDSVIELKHTRSLRARIDRAREVIAADMDYMTSLRAGECHSFDYAAGYGRTITVLTLLVQALEMENIA